MMGIIISGYEIDADEKNNCNKQSSKCEIRQSTYSVCK